MDSGEVNYAEGMLWAFSVDVLIFFFPYSEGGQQWNSITKFKLMIAAVLHQWGKYKHCTTSSLLCNYFSSLLWDVFTAAGGCILHFPSHPIMDKIQHPQNPATLNCWPRVHTHTHTHTHTHIVTFWWSSQLDHPRYVWVLWVWAWKTGYLKDTYRIFLPGRLWSFCFHCSATCFSKCLKCQYHVAVYS